MLDVDVEVDRRDFAVRAAMSVEPGERLALFGPSGAGKTTVLEAIAGLTPLRRGSVVVGGRTLTSTAPQRRSLPPWQRRVGLLRQEPALFPHLSVRGNLRYARPARDGEGELLEVAKALGIDGLLSAMPARLSGGQAQRVALGRLLLARCDVLLLDEPFSGLDAALRRPLIELVVRLIRVRRVPGILVAHELADAQAFAGRMAVIARGRVLQAGTPHDVVVRPASRQVAELVGYLGFVPVRPRGLPGETGSTVAGIHPERVIAGRHPDRGIVLSGTMTACRPSAAGWEADLGTGSQAIVCKLADRPGTGDGALVVTAVDPPCFGPDGALLPDAVGGWPEPAGPWA